MDTLIWFAFAELALVIVFCVVMVFLINRTITLFATKRSKKVDLYNEELREINELLTNSSLSPDGKAELVLRKYEIERALLDCQKNGKNSKTNENEGKDFV